MDLMKGSTNFRALSRKYDEFRAPSAEITVGGTKLAAGANANIRDVELELTSGYEASGCVFYIDGAYDEEKTDFKKFVKKIQIGEDVEVAMGHQPGGIPVWYGRRGLPCTGGMHGRQRPSHEKPQNGIFYAEKCRCCGKGNLK